MSEELSAAEYEQLPAQADDEPLAVKGIIAGVCLSVPIWIAGFLVVRWVVGHG